MKDTCR